MLQQADVKSISPHVCSHKIAFFLDNWVRRLIQNPRKIAGEYVKKGDITMDIGCGPGFFSIDMAKLVGKQGKVIAIDLQAHMLTKVKRKASRYGLESRMEFHQCEADRIGLNRKADFILAFYMVHETPSPRLFFQEIKGMLTDSGRLLVVEPKMHVSKTAFTRMLADAESVGLRTVDFPKRKGGRSALFAL